MKHLRRFFAPLALTTLIIGGLACGDVGGDPPGDAGLSGGNAGVGGSGANGGTGGNKPDGGGGVGAADVANDARVDVSADVGAGGAGGSGSTIEAGRDSADVRGETGTDGAGGMSGASGAGGGAGKAGAGLDAAGGASGASGAAGASGGAGTAGSGGTSGTAGASGAAGTGGVAGAAGSTVDAAVDVGSAWDGAILIEGGRDAPTTTTEAILTAASPDCLACVQEGGAAFDPTCDLAEIRCEKFPDLARQLNCLDTLACVLPPGSGVSCVIVDTAALTPCYCGTVATEDCIAGRPASDGGVYGTCKGYIDVGFPGQGGAFIAKNLTEIEYGAGRAMQIAKCATSLLQRQMDERCRSCF